MELSTFYTIAISALLVSTVIALLVRKIRTNGAGLVRLELFSRYLIKHQRDMVVVTNEDGEILSASESFGEALGLSNPEGAYGSFSELFQKKNIHSYATILEYVRREKKPLVDYSVTIFPDDLERELELTVVPVLDSSKQILGLIHFLRPPSNRSEISRDLGHLEKLTNIGQIAAGMAHELNTPLGSIILSADLITEQLGDSSPVAEEASRIKRQADHCSKVVRQLLSYVRKDEHVRSEQELKSVIEKVIELLGGEARRRRITISIVTSHDKVRIPCNENQIEQLFFNMISNSFHAVGQDGTISIEIGLDTLLQQVKVSCTDDGHGIAKDHIEKIFEPFFTTKPGKEGTGLGLALCRKIMLEHGGRITVESKLGRGTTFSLYFPAAT